jgi:hypothetical protein
MGVDSGWRGSGVETRNLRMMRNHLAGRGGRRAICATCATFQILLSRKIENKDELLIGVEKSVLACSGGEKDAHDAQVALWVPSEVVFHDREGAEPGLRDFQTALRRLLRMAALPQLRATRDAGRDLLKNRAIAAPTPAASAPRSRVRC